MIDPVAFTINIGSFALVFRWYGIIVVFAIAVGAWLVEREIQRHGEDPAHVWGALIWILPAGIVGARLGYVINDILGGGRVFLNNPLLVFQTWRGGIHIYGALVTSAVAVYYYSRKYKLDMTLALDAVGPALLIGQAIGRIANFIIQELYGPPTTLPWGIKIFAENRIPPWTNLAEFPVDTTRFHPTFAYEMVWNLLAAALLIYVMRKYADKLKPGVIFAGWLLLEGGGRFWIEWFRPDQPRLGATDISFSRLAALLMAIAGVVIILAKYEIIKVPFVDPSRTSYDIAPPLEKEKTELKL